MTDSINHICTKRITWVRKVSLGRAFFKNLGVCGHGAKGAQGILNVSRNTIFRIGERGLKSCKKKKRKQKDGKNRKVVLQEKSKPQSKTQEENSVQRGKEDYEALKGSKGDNAAYGTGREIDWDTKKLKK